MKGLVALAFLLGIAGTALGVIALIDDMDGTFEKKTITVSGNKNLHRVEYHAPAERRHPLGTIAWTTTSEFTGDRSGELVRTCVPIANDDISCVGAYQFDNGTVQFQAIETVTKAKTTATPAIIGGTGAYAGATGDIHLNFAKHQATLHVLVPRT
jgi:hypothetical protein